MIAEWRKQHSDISSILHLLVYSLGIQNENDMGLDPECGCLLKCGGSIDINVHLTVIIYRHHFHYLSIKWV